MPQKYNGPVYKLRSQVTFYSQLVNTFLNKTPQNHRNYFRRDKNNILNKLSVLWN